MTLNAQERVAVEAAMSRAHSEESGPYRRIIARVPWPTDAVYALGHLSGFRAGVEAALEIVNRDFERGRLGSYTLDSIRALLAQESER